MIETVLKLLNISFIETVSLTQSMLGIFKTD